MQISSETSVLIITHYFKKPIQGGEPAQDIRDYLLPKVKSLVYFEHPFPFADQKKSFATVYENGVVRAKLSSFGIKGPDSVFYFLNLFFTIYFILVLKRKYDICISLDNLNTISVLPFRKLKLIKKLIFYTIDYHPQRFRNKTMNRIYHWVDKIVCYNSDRIWVLSSRMTVARQKMGLSVRKLTPSILVPMWADTSRIKVNSYEKINKNTLVYLGSLNELKGVGLIINAMPLIFKKNPYIKLLIIGEGKEKKNLQKLATSLKILENVEFLGFIKTQTEVEKLLCKSAIGLAPYVPVEDNLAYYTDPGKPKLYLGCGLPVIITKVPAIANIIQRKKAGFAIPYDSEELAKKVTLLLGKPSLYRRYRRNAIKLSKFYDTTTIISNAIKEA